MAAISGATFSSGQYLSKALTGAVNLRASHSIAVRVKHSSTATNTDTVCIGYLGTSFTFNASGTGVGRNNGVASTALNVYRINDSFSPTSDSAARSTCYGNTSTWYHICCVYNASTQQIRFYIDGTFIGQTASNTTRTTSTTSTTMSTAQSPGKFADFAFYNVALSDSDVQSLSDYRVPQVTSGLVCFARLDSDGTDSSGNGNTLTTAGSGTAITWSTSDNPPQPENPTVALAGGATSASTLSGALTKALAVAGAPSTASTLAGDLRQSLALAGAPTSASTLAGNLTLTKQLTAAASSASSLAAWIRPRWGRRIQPGGFGVYRFISPTVSASGTWTLMTWYRTISPAASGGYGDLLLKVNAVSSGITLGTLGTQLRLLVFDNTLGTVVSYTTADDAQWHHLAATYDGTTVRVYLDGTQVGSAAAALAGTYDFLQLSAGSGTGATWEGAHAKLWAATLSAAEISSEATYYTPHTSTADVKGWWRLAWQNVTLDSSSNGQTLTNDNSLEAQTESPGLPLTDLAGAPVTTSTLAGTLSLSQALVGGPTSSSTLTGTLTQAQPLVAAPSSASSLTGTLSQAQPLTSAATSATTLAGTLSQAQPLAAAPTTTSSLAGSLAVSAALAGAAGSASTLAGTLGQALVLAGAATTGSTLTGALGIEGTFSGNALTTSALAGTLSVDKPIAGTASTTSALTGILSQLQPLGAAAASASTLSGAITVVNQAAGNAATASTLSGTLGVANALAAAPSSASTLSGTLLLTQQLAASAQSASTLTGALSIAGAQVALAAAATSSSVLTGALSVLGVVRQVFGAPSTASTLTGFLTVTVPASARGNVVTDGSATAFYGVPPPTITKRRPWPPRPR